MDGIWCVEIHRGTVGGCSLLHATYYLLVMIAVVDIRCKHLIGSVVVSRDVKGVEAE